MLVHRPKDQKTTHRCRLLQGVAAAGRLGTCFDGAAGIAARYLPPPPRPRAPAATIHAAEVLLPSLVCIDGGSFMCRRYVCILVDF